MNDVFYVYLMESAHMGRAFIKIGISVNPTFRARYFVCHSPIPVNLIAQWRGSFGEEKQLHKRFQKFRKHGEWFVREGELAQFVEERRGAGVRELKPKKPKPVRQPIHFPMDAALQSILETVERYLNRVKMPATMFGKLAVGNTGLLTRMRSGYGITTVTISAIRQFMAANKTWKPPVN